MKLSKYRADIDGLRAIAVLSVIFFHVSFEDREAHVKRLLEGLERFLNAVGPDRKVILMGNVPSANLRLGYLGCAFRPLSKAVCHKKFGVDEGEFAESRSALRDFAEQRPNVWFFDPYSALCDGAFCYVVNGKDLYYSDHAHLSETGAQRVIGHFSDRLTRIVSE